MTKRTTRGGTARSGGKSRSAGKSRTSYDGGRAELLRRANRRYWPDDGDDVSRNGAKTGSRSATRGAGKAGGRGKGKAKRTKAKGIRAETRRRTVGNGRGAYGRGGGPSRSRRVMGVFATLFAMIALVAVAARALPADLQATPYVPILVSATPWFILLAALSFVLAFVSKRAVTAVVALALLAVNVWWQYPFFRPEEKLPGRALSAVAQSNPVLDDAYARVMTFNVYKGRADAKVIVDTVRDQRVEVLALQETTKGFVDALDAAGIGDYLPYSHVSSSDGVYGNGLWSATPLGDVADDDVDSSASFMPGGTVSFAGGTRRIRFVSVHTTAPVPHYWNQWKRSLDELALMRSHADVTYVFMGDFNATYDHAPFRGFLGDRFRDAARMAGRGFTFTWPADRIVPPAFAGIDHVVVDRGITAGRMQVVRIKGSDHEALLATLAFE